MFILIVDIWNMRLYIVGGWREVRRRKNAVIMRQKVGSMTFLSVLAVVVFVAVVFVAEVEFTTMGGKHVCKPKNSFTISIDQK